MLEKFCFTKKSLKKVYRRKGPEPLEMRFKHLRIRVLYLSMPKETESSDLTFVLTKDLP